MSRRCDISAKSAQRGFNVSHAHNKTKKVWDLNLKKRRLYDSESGKWLTLKVSTRTLRTIDKLGLSSTIRKAFSKSGSI